jgi:hypothetical protein
LFFTQELLVFIFSLFHGNSCLDAYFKNKNKHANRIDRHSKNLGLRAKTTMNHEIYQKHPYTKIAASNPLTTAALSRLIVSQNDLRKKDLINQFGISNFIL